MTATQAKGLPEHVLAKLDFPLLPAGYRWRVHKPFRDKYTRYNHAEDMTICVQIEIDRRAKWFSEYKVVVDGPNPDKVQVWVPTEGTLAEALNECADRTFARFEKVNADLIAKARADEQVAALWAKP